MSELQAVARCRVHDGKLEEFKHAAAECMRITREKDSGTLQYDWHFTSDLTECIVLERYRDSNAVMEHLANLGEAAGVVFSVADVSLQVFGEPSAELMAASEGMDITVHTHFQSL